MNYFAIKGIELSDLSFFSSPHRTPPEPPHDKAVKEYRLKLFQESYIHRNNKIIILTDIGALYNLFFSGAAIYKITNLNLR